MANILLARQDKAMRGYLAQQLRRYGHRVTVTDCHDGILAAVNDNGAHYAMLITDLGLDGRDGFALVKDLRHAMPDLRMVFMSGFSGIGLVYGPGRAFNARIITEPFHLRELPEQINIILSAEVVAA